MKIEYTEEKNKSIMEDLITSDLDVEDMMAVGYALAKQISMPPTPETIDEKTGVITEPECPTCGVLAIKHKAAIYCHNCGQRLK